jgi:ketosteroid isomerase-like protein
MMLSRVNIGKALDEWLQAWNGHDLEGVMDLLHYDVVFEHWDSRIVTGKRALRKVWLEWFSDPGGFRFTLEDAFIDVDAQKALFQWILEWPSRESGWEGRPEKRSGVDVLHFRDGKIMRKLTYCKTSIEIAGGTIRLTAAR